MSAENQPVEPFLVGFQPMRVQPDRRPMLPSAEKMASYVAGSYDPGVGKDWTAYMSRNIEPASEVRKRLDFIFDYEIDPLWRRFCTFTHEDIGGPFEQLGIIRKRAKPPISFKPMMYQVEDMSIVWSEVPLDVRARVSEIVARAIEAVDSHSEKMVVGFNIGKPK